MITPGLTYPQYCELKGFNYSLLKKVSAMSLMHVKAYMEGKLARKTKSTEIGQSFHDLTLRQEEDFVVRPETYTSTPELVKLTTDFNGEWNPRRAPCKEWKSAFEAQGIEVMTPEQFAKSSEPKPWNANAGVCQEWAAKQTKRPVTKDEEARIRGMVTAVHCNRHVAPYLDAQCEVAVTGERKGQAFKSLIDILPNDETAPIIDLKSCMSADPVEFTRQAINLGYHIQAAMNLDVLRMNGQTRREFWFMAVESEYPHATFILKLRDEPYSFIRQGRIAYRAATTKLQRAIRDNHWPDYEPAEAEAVAPDYLKKDLDSTL